MYTYGGFAHFLAGSACICVVRWALPLRRRLAYEEALLPLRKDPLELKRQPLGNLSLVDLCAHFFLFVYEWTRGAAECLSLSPRPAREARRASEQLSADRRLRLSVDCRQLLPPPPVFP